MENENSESKKSAMLAIMELCFMSSVPMSLDAVARLNVADAMWQDGANAPLSTSEIISRILPSGGGDTENLQSMLRLLASYGVFSEHIDNDAIQRKYSLTEIGKTLVTDVDGHSMAPYLLQHHEDAIMRAWSLLHETVLEPTTVPFVKHNGMSPYQYYSKMPVMSDLMLKGMAGFSMSFMKTLLSTYNGFEGVEKLVDVGGCGGDCLKMILQKYPNISEAINFDLPEVIAKASHIPGVTHVGGDVMKSNIPLADAIFIKYVLLTFTDNECEKTMENCYKALPLGGKLIICEPIWANKDIEENIRKTRFLLEVDIYCRATHSTKGKHRTEAQFMQFGRSAGFSSCKAYYIDDLYTLLEFLK